MSIDFKALAAPIENVQKFKKTWKDKRTGAEKFIWLDYITARTVMNRLDRVAGPENWRADYEVLSGGAVKCTLYLRIDSEWIGKTDVGVPSDIEPAKGAVSDAFKRAAVHWGIGRELYEEGTAFDSEPAPDASQERRLPKPSKPTPATEDEPANRWATDKNVISAMLEWARTDAWAIEGEQYMTWPHVYARVGKALGLSTTPKTSLDVHTAILEGYAGSKADAVAAIQGYKADDAVQDEAA